MQITPAGFRTIQPIRFAALPTIDGDQLKNDMDMLLNSSNPKAKLAVLDVVYMSNSDLPLQSLQACLNQIQSVLPQAQPAFSQEDERALNAVIEGFRQLYTNPANKFLQQGLVEGIVFPFLRDVDRLGKQPGNETLRDNKRAHDHNSAMMVLPARFNFDYSK